MGYRRRTGLNWGTLIACAVGAYFVLQWLTVALVGPIVCADAAARCSGSFFPKFLVGLVFIVAGSVALGWTINWIIRLVGRATPR
jgi:hypothetical protein